MSFILFIFLLYLFILKIFQGKWIYDLDPFEPLKYQEPLQNLKARVAAEGSKAVFSPLIERYILNNPHRVTVEMQVSL
jgi:presequence protease